MNITQAPVEKKYAIIETGGKQYQAVVGKTLSVEKIEGEPGSEVIFDKVLFLKDGSEEKCEIGMPLIKNASVKASIVKQTKDKKIVIFKFQRRKRVRIKKGHRQPKTVIRFESINLK